MKDKLKKYNRKAGYYRFTKTLIACGFVFGAVIAFTIPVSISLSMANARAEQDTQLESVDSIEDISLEYQEN